MRLIGQVMLWITAVALVSPATSGPAAQASSTVGEQVLLDNTRVMVVAYTFPPGFRGDEHAAVADEFAYVLDGRFTVATRGRGSRVVGPGEIEYATKGTVHASMNEAARPARVLVVLLKER